MDVTEQAITTLRKAKDHLFEKGWKKGDYGPEEGPNCLAGAIIHSTIEKSSYITAYTAVEKVVRGERDTTIVLFNDRKDTTFDDVVDVLDLAIKVLESREEGN